MTEFAKVTIQDALDWAIANKVVLPERNRLAAINAARMLADLPPFSIIPGIPPQSDGPSSVGIPIRIQQSAAQSLAAADRLRHVARSALTSSPNSWDGAKDAFYRSVRDDAEMLWELLTPYRAQAAQFWLTECAGARRTAEAQDRDNYRNGAQGRDDHGSRSNSAPRASAAAGARAVGAVARLSLLDTFKINGKSIGDCTVAEAKRWATASEIGAAFVRSLVQNLADNVHIRKWRSAEEAQAAYEQAEACFAD